ncbi:hypothetical protein ACFONG_15420 [Uliginosibacterium paludis]|uniref:Lipoprotein n=1 Tax=Uliginosibacterium paludis TaxID=1615952 RepID=A0ABV2CU25_9RHOO
MKSVFLMFILAGLSACATTPETITTAPGWRPIASTEIYSVDIKNSGIEIGRKSIEAITRWNFVAQSDLTITNTTGHSKGSAFAGGAYGIAAISGDTDSAGRSVTSVEKRPAHAELYKVELEKDDCLQGYGSIELERLAGDDDDRDEEWAEDTNSAPSRIADYLCSMAGWKRRP